MATALATTTSQPVALRRQVFAALSIYELAPTNTSAQSFASSAHPSVHRIILQVQHIHHHCGLIITGLVLQLQLRRQPRLRFCLQLKLYGPQRIGVLLIMCIINIFIAFLDSSSSSPSLLLVHYVSSFLLLLLILAAFDFKYYYILLLFIGLLYFVVVAIIVVYQFIVVFDVVVVTVVLLCTCSLIAFFITLQLNSLVCCMLSGHTHTYICTHAYTRRYICTRMYALLYVSLSVFADKGLNTKYLK